MAIDLDNNVRIAFFLCNAYASVDHGRSLSSQQMAFAELHCAAASFGTAGVIASFKVVRVSATTNAPAGIVTIIPAIPLS